MKNLPTTCPSCSSKLAVKRLRCEQCETEVEGLYSLPLLASLSQDDQEFILEFIKASGSLKEMAAILHHLHLKMPGQYAIVLLNLARDLARRLSLVDEAYAVCAG